MTEAKDKHKACLKNGKAQTYLNFKDLIECMDKEPCTNKVKFASKHFCKNRNEEKEIKEA
jgi:hypothetical protein